MAAKGVASAFVLLLSMGCLGGVSDHPFLECRGDDARGAIELRVEMWREDGPPARGSCVQAWPLPVHGVFYGRRAADGVAILHVDPGPWRVWGYLPDDDDGTSAWTNETEVNLTSSTTVTLVLGPGRVSVV